MCGTVLLVEDSPDDALFMTRAFAKSVVPHVLRVVEDGGAALDYLGGQGKYEDRSLYPLPKLVLFDLKMQPVAGFDLLRSVRRQPTLATMIMVVLTSSDHPNDIRQAYALGANSFLNKPGQSDELTELVKSIADYWLKRNVTGPTLLVGQKGDRGNREFEL